MSKILIENWDRSGKEFDPCSLYNWRLDWLENKILQHRSNGLSISEVQYQKWYDEEDKVFQNNKRDQESANKLTKKIGIIVPTHRHHRMWIRACLQSLQSLGYFVLLAFDNPFADNAGVETKMPSSECLRLADYISIKHKTWGSGVGIPHAWNMFYGVKQLKSLGFEYIFNLNGDCILERPEGFPEIIEMLGNEDAICCEYRPERRYAGTMSWLAKTEIVDKCWTQYIKELYMFNIGNAERRWGQFLWENKCSVVSVKNPFEPHFKPFKEKNETDLATWRTILGLRHLHAEHKVRRIERMEPVEEKYFEKGPVNSFLSGYEQKTLLLYWKTGDKKYLEEWWG